jgi:hypothetical protein
MATAPSSWAGTEANEPLKEPTAVRAALAMTIDCAEAMMMKIPFCECFS